MFYYLSFLRPPPQCAVLSGPVTITPQLANDLRTELLEQTHDIYYSWSLVPTGSSSSDGSKFPVITKPRKLTSWRPDNAYKEIRVPAPPNLREGQTYSLVLTTHDQGHPHVINLAGPSCGTRPFPVVSPPILFSSRGRQDAAKQERIQRVYRIPAMNGQVFLQVTEQTSFDLDKVSCPIIISVRIHLMLRYPENLGQRNWALCLAFRPSSEYHRGRTHARS